MKMCLLQVFKNENIVFATYMTVIPYFTVVRFIRRIQFNVLFMRIGKKSLLITVIVQQDFGYSFYKCPGV